MTQLKTGRDAPKKIYKRSTNTGEKCPALLIIRAMQITITMIHSLIPFRMAASKTDKRK